MAWRSIRSKISFKFVEKSHLTSPLAILTSAPQMSAYATVHEAWLTKLMQYEWDCFTLAHFQLSERVSQIINRLIYNSSSYIFWQF